MWDPPSESDNKDGGDGSGAGGRQKGPVLNLINARIRALHKKQNRILQMKSSGGGFGNGRRFGGEGDGRDDQIGIGEYYQRMLKANPVDSLLLRNHSKCLHEVEKDTVSAEECYGRAILASPGDGELLSLYGQELDLGNAERWRESAILL